MLQDGVSGSGEGSRGARRAVALLSDAVRAWFVASFPEGPTPAQVLAWPVIAAGENALLIAPTGTGKTLAAFLSVVDRLFREREAGPLAPGLRCVYVSPLRSLNYDIERNLAVPLAGIAGRLELDPNPIRVGVRTGDTSAYERRKLRDDPPHILITTPESLSLLLSQESWRAHWQTVEHLIIDEVHALAPTRRGADLAVSLERVAAQARRDPRRIGLSATCRADESIVRFLVGTSRSCRVLEAPAPEGTPPAEFAVESLIRPGEAPHRGLTYRRLLRRLRRMIDGHRTTIIFANTRAFAEKITHDLLSAGSALRCALLAAGRGECSLRSAGDGGDPDPPSSPHPAAGAAGAPRSGAQRSAPRSEPQAIAPRSAIAAHHSALDAHRRRAIEAGLKSGELRGRDEHQLGAGSRYRRGRPDGPGGLARRRVAVRAARGPIGSPPRRGVARSADRGNARRARRRGDHGTCGSGGPGRAVAFERVAAGCRLPADRRDGLRR